MKKIRWLVLLIFLFLFLGMGKEEPDNAYANACDTSIYISGTEKTHLVELFTTEECSSCPPAEKWLNSLSSHPGLWRDFVPVAFHVSYWGYLGWKDPIAKPEYSARHKSYAKSWKSVVYTPTFALDGREWRMQLSQRVPPTKSDETAGVLKVTRETTGKLAATYFPPRNETAGSYIMSAALLGHGIAHSMRL